MGTKDLLVSFYYLHNTLFQDQWESRRRTKSPDINFTAIVGLDIGRKDHIIPKYEEKNEFF